MTAPKTKAGIGLTLILLFLVTLGTGIIPHLKKHGIIIEPRPVIKAIHWAVGFLMIILAVIHGALFIFLLPSFLTGFVKLVSPVKIPNLGLHHYWFGILMSTFIALQLIRGLPGWNRLRKIKSVNPSNI